MKQILQSFKAVANFSENVDEDFAAVEFVPEDDFYHVIGTSLINYTMPLLRYGTAIPISFERVEKVPRTARGKLRYIVSEVKQALKHV